MGNHPQRGSRIWGLPFFKTNVEIMHRHKKEAKSVHGVGKWLGQFYILKVIQQEFEGAGHFLFCEQSTWAEMPPATECQVCARIAPFHIELVRALKFRFISIGRAITHQHHAVFLDQGSANCDVLFCSPG